MSRPLKRYKLKKKFNFLIIKKTVLVFPKLVWVLTHLKPEPEQGGGAVGRTAQDASLPTGYGPLTKQISKNDISL